MRAFRVRGAIARYGSFFNERRKAIFYDSLQEFYGFLFEVGIRGFRLFLAYF